MIIKLSSILFLTILTIFFSCTKNHLTQSKTEPDVELLVNYQIVQNLPTIICDEIAHRKSDIFNSNLSDTLFINEISYEKLSDSQRELIKKCLPLGIREIFKISEKDLNYSTSRKRGLNSLYLGFAISKKEASFFYTTLYGMAGPLSKYDLILNGTDLQLLNKKNDGWLN